MIKYVAIIRLCLFIIEINIGDTNFIKRRNKKNENCFNYFLTLLITLTNNY